MTIRLSASATGHSAPLHHFWNVAVGAQRAAEGLRADWQSQLATVVDQLGYRYLRFHGLFHDDMFVYREVDGAVEPYFRYIDVLFDRLLEIGIRPFVEFGFSPGSWPDPPAPSSGGPATVRRRTTFASGSSSSTRPCGTG